MYDALQFLSITALIAGIALVLAKALHAQPCTTLAIPFNRLDDLKLYEKSSGRLFSPAVYVTALITGVAGAWAMVSPEDLGYARLISLVAMIAIFVGIAGARSYRIFGDVVRANAIVGGAMLAWDAASIAICTARAK